MRNPNPQLLLPRGRESEARVISKRKEILCVCHDELTLQVRQMLLEHFGYRVLITGSVGKMNAILRQACPDMLLLDTSDPELDWQEIAGKAKSICPDILAVVLTADYGRLDNDHQSVDRFLRLDGPREEWMSGIEALFAQRYGESEASGAIR
jgi:CheY-like chemotaxis protein